MDTKTAAITGVAVGLLGLGAALMTWGDDAATIVQDRVIEEVTEQGTQELEKLNDLIVEWTVASQTARDRLEKDIAQLVENIDKASLPEHQQNFLESIGL